MSNCCRNCAHYEARPDRDGKVRMRRNSVSQCVAPIDTGAIMALLPKSITDFYSFRTPSDAMKRWMGPGDGYGCPLHKVRE